MSLLATVKSGKSALEIPQELMPVDTHPMEAIPPDWTFFGVAATMMFGRLSVTVHEDDCVTPPAVHESVYVALEAVLDVAVTAWAEPDDAPPVSNPTAVDVALLVHANEMAMMEPGSAVDGEQEICALLFPPVPPCGIQETPEHPY